ncbi:paraquat-inducible protein A [uncultured Thiodictyon sp.]|uniref:paraquat-inducible protein A n=1 Tax=uncultured Thiodictyon sp. TaxID=1846217 RepID=UPI0025FE8085|nr:paraquat-inducible protein A [uncultured Thiodictyon sp.]
MSAALIARRALAALVFVAALLLTAHLTSDLNRVKALKTELGEIDNVRYGLLDADQWVLRISAAMERRIAAFELTDANRPQVKRAVEQVLDTLLVEIDHSLRRHNLQGGGSVVDQLKGIVQQGLQDLVIDFDRLRRKVPQYADQVVDELSKPEAKREIKAQLQAFIQSAAGATFAKTDRSLLNALLAAHRCADVAACDRQLGAEIAAAHRPILYQVLGVFGLVGVLFALCLGPWTGRSIPEEKTLVRPPGLDPFQLFLLTGATLILLLGGLLTPMIEIDARISELTLQLVGEPIAFTNQVLYFQTKSVFDVAAILLRTGAADMILVAVLIVVFSVIFPAIKVVATWLYYYDYRGLRGTAAVRFFALKSGKWSMADVLVIAIFMAYIGFSGLVGSQLGDLRQASTAVDVLTTNGTILAPGFYLFLGFVLASLWLSSILEARLGESHPS